MTILTRYVRSSTPQAPANFKNTKGSRITSRFRVEGLKPAKFKKRDGLAHHLNQRLELHVGFGFDILTVAALLFGVIGLLGIVSHRALWTLVPASAANKSVSAHVQRRAPNVVHKVAGGAPTPVTLTAQAARARALSSARPRPRARGASVRARVRVNARCYRAAWARQPASSMARTERHVPCSCSWGRMPPRALALCTGRVEQGALECIPSRGQRTSAGDLRNLVQRKQNALFFHQKKTFLTPTSYSAQSGAASAGAIPNKKSRGKGCPRRSRAVGAGGSSKQGAKGSGDDQAEAAHAAKKGAGGQLRTWRGGRSGRCASGSSASEYSEICYATTLIKRCASGSSSSGERGLCNALARMRKSAVQPHWVTDALLTERILKERPDAPHSSPARCRVGTASAPPNEASVRSRGGCALHGPPPRPPTDLLERLFA